MKKRIDYFLRFILLGTLLVVSSLQLAQAQTVTAIINGEQQNFDTDALTIGSLAKATAITVSGEWTNTQLLNLQKALKSSWSSAENTTENNILTLVDMSPATFSGDIPTGMAYMFRLCAVLTSVTLPEVTSDNQISLCNTFRACEKLTTLNNLEKLTNIINLDTAFRYCIELESITLPEGTKAESISFYDAFISCAKLKEINNLDKFNNISNMAGAFRYCYILEEVTLPEGTNAESISFSYAFSECKKLTKVTNLEKFTNINSLAYAFQFCEELVSITLPKGSTAESITFEYALRNCKKLPGIIDLREFTNISSLKYTFSGCALLTEITLPEGTTSKENMSFYFTFSDCSSLTSIENLEKFTNISSLENTFSSCPKLSSITLPEGTTATDISFSSTFSGCYELSEITNLDKFNNISKLEKTFDRCRKLQKITFSSDTNDRSVDCNNVFFGCTMLKTIENFDAFTNISRIDYAFAECRVLESITLPAGTKNQNISFSSTFYGCTNLKTINNFDKFIRTLYMSRTFSGCYALTEIRLGMDPNILIESNSTETFNNTNPACLKYLPEGVKTIPNEWIKSGYNNFVVPFEIDDIKAPTVIAHGEALTLPTVLTYTPNYAAVKGTGTWQIQKSGETDWNNYTEGTTLDLVYDKAKLRWGGLQGYTTDDLKYSNEVEIEVIVPFAGGDGTKSKPYLIDNEARLRYFATKTEAIYGKLIADVTLCTDASFGDATTLIIGTNRILTLGDANNTPTVALPKTMILEGAEIDGVNANVTSINELTVCKTVDCTNWNAIALPFVPTSVVLTNSNGTEKGGIFIDKTNSTNGLPKMNDEYTSMSYDGQARYSNGLTDPNRTNNWRYKKPANGVIGEMFAFGSGVKSVAFSIKSPATTILTEKGSTASLTYHAEEAGKAESHRGWNCIDGSTTRSMQVQRSGEGPVMVQVYDENNNNYITENIGENGYTAKPFTPLFVKTVGEEQTVMFGDGSVTRAASAEEVLYCFELQDETGLLLDRLYVGKDLDTRLYNVPKMGAMGKAAVLAAMVNNEALCSVVAQQRGSVAQTNADINTAGRSDIYLVWTSGGNDRVWLNNSELRRGEAIAAINGNYALTIGATPSSIEELSTSVKVYGTQGAIVLEGIEEGSCYRVYDTSGTSVATAVASTYRVEIPLATGVYVVNIEGNVYKVTVK